MTNVRECSSRQEWDNIVNDLGGHPLQLWGWGEVKAKHNWQAKRLVFYGDNNQLIGAAQVLRRALPAPFTATHYIPRGPVCRAGDKPELLAQLTAYATQSLAGVSLTIEPDWPELTDRKGWKKAKNTILIPRTLILDLSKPEDELLAAMSKKTRQYIRKSGREGLECKQVKSSKDIAECLVIYRDTGKRAGFALHSNDYYEDIFHEMGDASPVYAAYLHGKPICFVWLAASNRTAFELYGGMNDTAQELRANYALKWFCIQQCKQQGIARYDMNGLLNDGISTFKAGFASHEDMLCGTYDLPLSPLYPVWAKGLPTAKKIIRKLKR